jgi:uncharacterized membrane protein (UPF0127 family)
LSGKTAVLITMGGTAVAILLLALVLGTCGTSENIEREALTIVAANGTTARLQVEVADSPEERQQGLMGRTDVPIDTGMLFVLEDCCRGFWMKDTPIPLSVAFIERCGRIIHIADLEPLSEAIVNAPGQYAFGLEVARGWYDRNGITIGDIVRIPNEHRPGDC